MTKRDIKTIVRQCQKGLEPEHALRTVIMLSEPKLTPKQVSNICRSITLFQGLAYDAGVPIILEV